jgi:hypothetical protein
MSIISPLIDQYTTCIGIDTPSTDIGFPNFINTLLEEIIIKPILFLATELYKIFQFIQKSGEAITKALAGNLKPLNELIDEYIIEPIESFTKVTTDTKQWIIDNFTKAFDKLLLPLPEFTISILGFEITFGSNKAYLDLDIKSPFKTPQWINQIYKIVKIITSSIATIITWLISKITEVLDIIKKMISITTIEDAIKKFNLYITKFTNPLIDTVDTWLKTIIGFFVDSTELIEEKALILYQWVMDSINLGKPDFDILPEELKIIAKMVFCTIKMIFSSIIFLLTFEAFI